MNILKKIALAGLVLGTGIAAARADYPERSIRLIVPFAAGGTTDIVGRIVADHLTEALKQPVVVDNRGGGGGSIGTDLAAKADPDGYTLLLGTVGPLAINIGLYPNLPYDPVKDFKAISLVAETPNLITVRPGLGVKTLEELVALGKKEPGKLNFGSAGSGSTSHLAGILFNKLTGADMEHIPYQGTGPAMTDMLAGRIDVIINNMPPMVPHVKSGAMVGLGLAGEARSDALPEVPTTAEAGLPDYKVTGWFGIFAPAGTPQPILDRLEAAVHAMDGSEMAKQRIADSGAEFKTSSQAEFTAYLVDEIDLWVPLVKESGATAD